MNLDDLDLDTLGEEALEKAGEVSPEELDFILLGAFLENPEEEEMDDDEV